MSGKCCRKSNKIATSSTTIAKHAKLEKMKYVNT